MSGWFLERQSLKNVIYTGYTVQGVKLTFIPGSHLAPKYFKVVANSKKSVAIMTQKNNFYPVTVLARATKRDTRMGHIQRERLPKIDLRLKSGICCILELSLTRNFAADLYKSSTITRFLVKV